jgi:hypothetical protein
VGKPYAGSNPALPANKRELMIHFLEGKIPKIAEKILEHINIEEVTKDVLSSLTVKNLEIYFVVRKPDGQDDYEFVGLAYSKGAAETLWCEATKEGSCKILALDLGKALNMAEEHGIVKAVKEG